MMVVLICQMPQMVSQDIHKMVTGGFISPDDMMPSDGVNNKGDENGGN